MTTGRWPWSGHDFSLRRFLIRFLGVLGLLLPSIASAVMPMPAVGLDFAVALRADGTVLAWGDNRYGQLGDGTRTNQPLPAPVPGLAGVIAVKAGQQYVVALKADGTVVGWGANSFRQLGDGSQTDRLTPVAIPGLAGVIGVAAGSTHTLALKSDGTVMAWGNDNFGQLGSGTWGLFAASPAPVPGLGGVVAVAAGDQHSLALKADGTVMAWGFNGYGQLGTGDTTQRSSPTAVPGLADVVAVAAGDDYSMALKSDGTVMMWGGGMWGGGTTSPVAVPGLTGAVSLSSLSASRLIFAVAVKSDGTAVIWSRTGEAPVAVPELAGVVSVASGDNHAVALKSDGTLAAWGWNDIGQLGDGTTISRINPVAVAGGSLGAAATTATLSPASLDFATQGMGSASALQLLTLTNTGSQPIYFPILFSSRDYPRITTCAAILATGTACTVSVRFAPIQLGLRNGGLSMVGNGTVLSSVGLTGTGVRASQTIGAIGFSPATLVVGGSATASATASSGLAVSFSSGTPGNCTVSGSTVTGIAAGTCTVAADQAGNANVYPAAQVTQGIAVGKAGQSIGAIGFSPASLVVGGSTTASATASSGLAVSFSSTTPAVCTVSGSTVTAIAAGTCTVAANQDGNGTYSAASQVTQGIAVGKASQSIGAIGFSNALTVGATATASATASSGLAVSFSSTSPAVCSVSGSTVTAIAAGTCTVAANQGGNGNYNAASQVTQGIAVGKVSQSIGAIGFSKPLTVGATATASATASSGLAVSFSSATPAVCTVSGTTVTAITAGTCTIAANQGGNGNYNPAAQVTQGIAVSALDLSRFLPNAAGNQWSYVNSNQATTTNTFGSPVVLPSGVVAIPWTKVVSGEPGYSVTYNTFDANGWRRYQEYVSSVYVNGYGYTSGTAVYSPPPQLVPATASPGATYTANSVVTVTYANVGTVVLNYSGTTQVVGFETVWNNAGTQSWSALKVTLSNTLYGTVNGQYFTTTSSSTSWLVDGLGPVKTYAPNSSGVMEMWNLTSTNVVAPTIIGSATAGNASATVSFYAPTSNGGSPIYGYTVTSSPGGITATGSTSPITVTGLSNGTAYTFTVKVTGSADPRATSAPSNAVTPSGPGVALSAASLSFPARVPGTSSSAQSITLTNTGTVASLAISGITVSGDFTRSTDCGATLAAGASCSIAVTFAPSAAGARTGTLSIASDAVGSPHGVALGGTGILMLNIPLTLAEGWNLLGNAGDQPLVVATQFSDANVVNSVWKWDAVARRWLFFTPLMDAAALQGYAAGKGYGVLAEVAPGEGYWLNAGIAAELPARTGAAFVLSTADLVPGWNLVATGQDVSPSAFNRSLSLTPPAPGAVPQNLVSLWAWDNPGKAWYFYAPGLEAQGGTALTDYITAKGYLDFTLHGKTLGKGIGFWVNRP